MEDTHMGDTSSQNPGPHTPTGLCGRSLASSARSAYPPLALFLCRTNTTCSIMAEAILAHLAQGRVRAASAGDVPHLQVNPHALECLRAHGIPTEELRSKVWGEFFGLCRPPVRFLIALTDVYAVEANWNEDTLIGYWNVPDPGAVVGSEGEIRLAFDEAFAMLRTRVQMFLALPFDQLNDQALSRELAWIGGLPWLGSSSHA